MRHLVLTKEKTSPAAPDTGDQVTYTLTVHNDGAGDWTAADPASVVDDLTEVLDDATWDDTAAATAGTVDFTAPSCSAGRGALAHGATVTITYSVTVTNQGDHELTNTASVPGCQLAECNRRPGRDPAAARGAEQDRGPGDGERRPAGRRGDLHAVVDQRRDRGRCRGQHRRPSRRARRRRRWSQEPTSSSPAVVATRTGDDSARRGDRSRPATRSR